MVFSSILFLFLYLPVVLGIYHLLMLPVTLGRRSRVWIKLCNLFLLVANVIFYAWGEPVLIWVMVLSCSIDYVAALVISGAWRKGPVVTLVPGAPRTTAQKLGLVLSLSSNLAFLCYFKYFNFGLSNYNSIVAHLGYRGLQLHDVARVALPLGISFYTFHSMSYTIDVYRGYATATRNYIDFASYVTLFSQLVAGPIVRYRHIAAMLVDRVVTIEGFASGVSRFIIGLGKKVLIANTVAQAADRIFALPGEHLTAGLSWLAVVCYTLQIYFDFSGYSDMAIGLGRMLGYDFLENFNYPYISRTITEFWRRWHISLSTWFRDYLYIPLGGNRKGPLRTYANLVTVFFLCGLWHGASWTFVVWGLYHGAFLVIERMGLGDLLEKRARIMGHVYSLLAAMGGWVLFRSESFTQAVDFFKAMAGFGAGAGTAYSVARYLTADVAIAIAAGAVFSVPVVPTLVRVREWILTRESAALRVWVGSAVPAVQVAALCMVLLESSMSLASGTHNPFIYFRF